MRVHSRFDLQLLFRLIGLATLMLCSLEFVGCKTHPPGGTTSQIMPLGSVVDEMNLKQEEHAEAAKFIVYVHEFELNEPLRLSDAQLAVKMRNQDQAVVTKKVGGGNVTSSTKQIPSERPRGYRLNEYGKEHLASIAEEILRGAGQMVMLERSQTSKRRDTRYQVPAHFNSRLDEERRLVVVEALRALGIEDADVRVVISPAFPFGLSVQEAAQAFGTTQVGQGGRGNFGGGRGGGGGF